VVGALATLYTAFLLFAAGPKFILVSFIIYAPATILFVMARHSGRLGPRQRITDLVVAALNRS
jgi:arginine:ornithine antiporter/lysine permease